MKISILNEIAALSLFLLLFQLSVFGQVNFSKLSVLGPEYKMISIKKTPRFTMQAEFGQIFPSQKGIESYNGGGMDSLIQKIYSDPQLFEELFERLGGEFFIGSFSEVPQLDNFKQEKGNYYGFSGAYRFNAHFNARLHFAAYKTQMTAEFPVVVFDQNTFETNTKKGNLTTDLQSNTIQFSSNYYPCTGVVQPFVGAGMAYTFTKSSVTKAELETVTFELSENPATHSFGFTFNAGLALVVHPNIVLQLNGQMFSVNSPDGSGAAWDKVISGGLGVRF